MFWSGRWSLKYAAAQPTAMIEIGATKNNATEM
jgi:hypothetical protein